MFSKLIEIYDKRLISEKFKVGKESNLIGIKFEENLRVVMN